MESVPDFDDLHPVVEVEIASLSIGGSPRSSGENVEHVEILATVQGALPPIVVHRPSMTVIDGAHRLRAALVRGDRTIAVRYFDGAVADAFVLAVKFNVNHGLPLSLADRKAAAERIIGSHPNWSDRMIGSVAGIAAKTAAELRRRLGPAARPATARVGRDGRIRSVDGSVGRKLAYELMRSDPGLSLRQVARAAGISPETARDVRNRMGRGEGPLPDGRGRFVQDGPLRQSRRAGLIGGIATRTLTVQPPAAVVQRLKADPSIRFNQNGRDLLRLLNIHTIDTEDWNRIIESVPPHCREAVAQLARECAEIWTDFGARIERGVG